MLEDARGGAADSQMPNQRKTDVNFGSDHKDSDRAALQAKEAQETPDEQ
jgi:hypothetical protein